MSASSHAASAVSSAALVPTTSAVARGRSYSADRLGRLGVGLVAFGVSLALVVKAHLGLGPWDVLHQGLAARSGLPMGWLVTGVGFLVLLGWIPLRQRPGIGTLCNVVFVGLILDLALDRLPSPDQMVARLAFFVVGVILNGMATGLYIGAGLGAGPRDGLMTGLAARGWSLRRARTSVDLAVLAAGALLGGEVGAGTVVIAVAIGPLAHFFLPRLTPRTTGGVLSPPDIESDLT